MDDFIFVLGYTILLDLRECVSSEKPRKFDWKCLPNMSMMFTEESRGAVEDAGFTC